MRIDDELVRHVAKLASLELAPQEVAVYREQLASIVAYVEQLKEVDVEGVEPLVHAGDPSLGLREDRRRDVLPAEEALRNAPNRAGPFFTVPRLLDP